MMSCCESNKKKRNNRIYLFIILFSFILLAWLSCGENASGVNVPVEKIVESDSGTCNCDKRAYAWNPTVDEHYRSICAASPPPAGYHYLHQDSGSYSHWLNCLPLYEDGKEVLLYNGQKKRNQSAQAAVIRIDPGTKDLQQCADACMRLRAEFLFNTKNYDAIAFNFTSGDRLEYSEWLKGKRIRIKGNKT
ncbi:MAG: hypothetical protein Fur0041_20320 [Bacteroidia bacterium]